MSLIVDGGGAKMEKMYKIEKEGSYKSERVGKLRLRRGEVATPEFMPVGTQGMVKLLTSEELKGLGYSIMLANAYHLYLRPGLEVINGFGGLHKFSNWEGNVLTDSGGYQGYSLSELNKITDEGIEFRSHIDGSKHLFTPKRVLEIQEVLGSEIVMPLDVCLGVDASYEEAREGVKRTRRWGLKSKEYSKGKDYILFGIVQGQFHKDLREESIRDFVEMDLKGYAIGGLSVGEERRVREEILEISTNLLPKDKPRYLMGIGKPKDIIKGVSEGVDLFDSVYPTRVGRNGSVFTKAGNLILKNKANRHSKRPIEEECGCYVCKKYTRGYLNHLFKSGEVLGPRLASYHNLYYMKGLMREIRESIEDDSFWERFKEWL